MADFLIAYGSQTGQAETIARNLKERCELACLKPRLFTLDQNEKEYNLEKEKFCAIIVSSTGDGDAPDNAGRFVRRICRRTLAEDFLKHLDYAILGLGDSNYSSYQAVPRRIDNQLIALGATRIFDRGEADDQVGLELAVEPWIDKLFALLAARFEISDDKLNVVESGTVKLNPLKAESEKQDILESMKPEKEERSEGPIILEPEPYDYPALSIRHGNEKLSADPNLRVPIAPQLFVQTSVSHHKFEKAKNVEWQNLCSMPGIVTKPFNVTVVGTALITDWDAVKPKRELVVDFGAHASDLAYEPGDALYFCVPNPIEEVNFVLKRCGVLDIADQECELSIDPKSEKINPLLPQHIHQKSSLRNIFTTCVDIRRAPGRPILRILAENTSDAGEKRRLLELCSAQGMADFTNYVRQPGLSLSDVLFAFPSVKPPVDRLIELLPRLIPRPYSMSSYNSKRARFVYSEMVFQGGEEGRRYTRKGLATDWLNSLRVGDIVKVMGKEPARFRLPPPPMDRDQAAKLRLLMVGPGTGVAVFLSFCHFLLKRKLETSPSYENVERILFFGCRDIEKDGIYIEELRGFVREGILTELIVCESQKNGERVQDGLKKNLEKVTSFLNPSTDSKIFICGDAKGMSKDVWQCFSDILAQNENISDLDAKKRLMDLKKSDQYIEDVWA